MPNLTQFLEHFKDTLNLTKEIKDLDKGDFDGLGKLLKEYGITSTKKSLIKDFTGILHEAESSLGFGWKKDHQQIDKSSKLIAHTLWLTWGEKHLIKGKVQETGVSFIKKACEEMGMTIKDGELYEHKVYMVLEYPIHASFGKLIETLQHKTSTFLKSHFPHLEEALEGMPLWESKTAHWTIGTHVEEQLMLLRNAVFGSSQEHSKTFREDEKEGRDSNEDSGTEKQSDSMESNTQDMSKKATAS